MRQPASPNADAFAAGGLSWRRWGPDAVAEAGARDCPLMVVVITGTDHWSARLAREVAADAEARAFVDEALVPVLVDREEAPALAARVQQLLALNGAQGYPAIAFALPDGALVGGIPWAPLRDRDKRAGLLRVAVDLVETWAQHPDDLRADARTLGELLARFADLGDQRGLPRPALALDAAEATLLGGADTLEGGFGPPPRFLQPALLGFLVQRALGPDAAPSAIAQLARTLDAWLAGATWDHLGGGIAHAATEAGFHRVLAERRLFDQAQLVPVLLQAATPCQRPAWRGAAATVIDWALSAFSRPGDADGAGGWACGIHADSPDQAGVPVDGAWYAWSQAAAADVVGETGAELFARRYLADERQAVDDAGTWRLPALRGEVSATERERIPVLCRRLAVARAQRPAPARDERDLAAASGAWLRALALAVALPEVEPAWRAAGAELAERLVDGDAGTDPGAEAWIGRGLAAWARTTGDPTALAAAGARGEALARRRSEAGLLPVGLDPILGPVIDATDPNDRPSPTAVAAELWLDLAEAEVPGPWLDRVDALLTAHAGLLRVAPASAAGLCALWQRRRRFSV